MFKKVTLGALMLVALSSTAWAQGPKVEITGLIGYTISDGVSGTQSRRATVRPTIASTPRTRSTSGSRWASS